jgi:16S rRNA (guanine966-N2)-methyltransferase
MDTLRPHLFGAQLLDLFAGQGRFGIEASYEQIASVIFVEKDRNTATTLKQNLLQKSFPKEVKTLVECQEAIIYLTHCSDSFDIVFADPPFPLWDEAFQAHLFSSVVRVLKPDSIFLVKSPSRMVLFPLSEDWKLIKKSEFGESLLLYYQYEGSK